VNPPSTATKAYVSAVIAICAAVGGTFADTGPGKFCVIIAAGLTAYLGVFKTKNTQTVETGPGDEPVTVATVVSDTGTVLGTITADTGTATGGIVAGTTGVLGQVLNATIGKVLPSGGGKHG
jgi:hypothetical protein